MKQLDEQLAELVKRGIEVAESTGNFVIEQAPQLLQEFYRWHMVSNLMGIAIELVLMFVAFKFFKMCGSKEEDNYNGTKLLGRYYETDEFPFFVLCVICLGVLLSIGICFIKDLFDLFYLLTAPKLYLIEYFTK